jgi:hypothetical protein
VIRRSTPHRLRRQARHRTGSAAKQAVESGTTTVSRRPVRNNRDMPSENHPEEPVSVLDLGMVMKSFIGGARSPSGFNASYPLAQL